MNNLEIFSSELKSLSLNLGEEFDPKLAKIDNIINELNKFSSELGPASEGLKSFEQSMATLQLLINDLNDGKGSLGKLLKDESLYDNLNEVVDNTNELIIDVKDNPTKYVKAYWRKKKNFFKVKLIVNFVCIFFIMLI